MSKMGNLVGQHLEINRDAVGGDLANVVSSLNNGWSAINNYQANDNLETVTSNYWNFRMILVLSQKLKL